MVLMHEALYFVIHKLKNCTLTRTWSNIIYEMDEKLLLQLKLKCGVIGIY